nr:hypothetical protein [Tanacetum cinerariifolium]
MEGGNTGEYANLVRKTDEKGNPIQTTLGETMDAERRELSTNVGHASGGAGCHYDFGDATGVGFGGAGAYLNQHGASGVGGGGDGKETEKKESHEKVDDHGKRNDEKRRS